MSTAYPPNRGMIVREVDREVLILDTMSNHIHQLNHTASIVWRMRREGSAEQAIAAALAQDFAIDEARALADVAADLPREGHVHDVLQRLESLNLLSADQGGSSHNVQGKEC